MEQKDYLLREVEKIGLVLRAILNGLFGAKENLAIIINSYFDKTNEELFNELGFDLKYFLILDESANKDYIARFSGINPKNLEMLADIIYQFGINELSDKKNTYWTKALQLYELCSKFDKTFSFDRENKIDKIKNGL
jgi:hypothetical protein